LLLLGKVPAELRLDVLEAAARRNHPGIEQKRQEYRDRLPNDDVLAGFRDTLMGGDAANGRRLFIERADTQCIRCHRVGAEAGGEVGPNLAGLARRATREYLLASIVQPSRDVVAGFENVTVGLKDGRSIAGVLKAETDRELSIFSLEDNGLVKVRKSEIATRVKGMSGMPEGLAQMFTLSELRDLMEFLATLK
jgi:quinoprotein glucose dehydrogenase